MTAIAALIGANAAWIASDGAAYTPADTIVRQIVPKVILCPEWDCVIGNRGMGNAADTFRLRAQIAGVLSFDELVERAGQLARETDDRLCSMRGGILAHFTVVLIGFSRSRSRLEAHVVRSRPGQAWHADAEGAVDLPAFTAGALGGMFLLPRPAPEMAAAVGLRLPGLADDFAHFTPSDAELFVMRAVLAARYSPASSSAGDAEYCVGGFVQLTRMQVHEGPEPQIVMDTQITMRWTDEIGRQINVFHDALPGWAGEPLAMSHDAEDEPQPLPEKE